MIAEYKNNYRKLKQSYWKYYVYRQINYIKIKINKMKTSILFIILAFTSLLQKTNWSQVNFTFQLQ
jgi:hypothetical protein